MNVFLGTTTQHQVLNSRTGVMGKEMVLILWGLQHCRRESSKNRTQCVVGLGAHRCLAGSQGWKVTSRQTSNYNSSSSSSSVQEWPQQETRSHRLLVTKPGHLERTLPAGDIRPTLFGCKSLFLVEVLNAPFSDNP